MVEIIEGFAFRVEPTPYTVVMYPGKVPGTVLVLDRQLFNWCIKEYTEPLSYGRHWDYAILRDALVGLSLYLSNEDDTEPGRWLRAVDWQGSGHLRHLRMRRAKKGEDGQRIEYEDPGE